MANVTVKDAAGATVNLKATGAGTGGDPFIPAHAIDSFPAANLSQRAMAASLSVVPANNITAGTYLGDVKVAGVSGTEVSTYTTSADMQAGAAITAAPTGGQKLVLCGLTLSTLTAMTFELIEETSNTVFMKFNLAANSAPVVLPLMDRWFKLAVADKKIFGKAGAAGNVYITAIYKSEA